jgi:hypothetical protein
MPTRRLLAAALAAQVAAAAVVLVTRSSPGGVATLSAGSSGGVDTTLVESSPLGDPLGAVPTPTPPTADPTALPSAPGVPDVPGVPGVPLPTVPEVSVPPVPTPSLPPVPTPSLPPVLEPREPECEEERGADELPGATSSVDLRGEGGVAANPFAAEGRVWFSVFGDGDPPHLVGVDLRGGDRVTIPTKDHTQLFDVVGHRAYAVEGSTGVVVYDVRDGSVLHRWDGADLRYGNDGLHPAAVAADAAGLWVLALGGSADDPVSTVFRLANTGETEWVARLPESRPTGFSAARGNLLAEHGGTVYVGDASAGRATFWRVTRDGTVAARHEPDLPARNADVKIVANAAGVFATVAVGENLDSRVLRLDPATLHVTGSQFADTVEHLFADEHDVYVVGLVCSFLLSRYDPATMRRTGFWRSDQSRQAYQGVVVGGAPWLLHTSGNNLSAVALRRYALP